MARLGDVVEIKASSKYVNGDKFWLLNLDMVEQQTGNVIDYNYVEKDALNGSIIQFDTDCVLYSKLRPNLNKVVIPNQDGFATSEILPLRPDKKVLTRAYLTTFLRSESFVTWAVSKTAGAKMPRLGSKELLNKEIPLPSLLEQERISKQFSKIDELIALRKGQRAKLDELVKSRFIELFGDPVTNSMGWDTETVVSVCDDIYGGGTPSKSHPEYYENGDIPWVSSKDMKTDVLYDSQIKINQLGVDNSTAKMVPINSVIMVIRSGILKHTLPVAINAVPITVNQDLKVFIPGEKILSVFLMYLFKMLEKDILSGVRAVTADNIEFDSLKKREVIAPPIELQEQFAAFVKQTDKSKLVILKSLENLEILKKALMQKYFG